MENKEIKKTDNSKASKIVSWLVALAVLGVISFNEIANYKVPRVNKSDIKAKEIEVAAKQMWLEISVEEDLKQPEKYDSIDDYYYIEKSENTIQAQDALNKAQAELEKMLADKRLADSLTQIPKRVRFKENVKSGLIKYHTACLNRLTR